MNVVDTKFLMAHHDQQLAFPPNSMGRTKAKRLARASKVAQQQQPQQQTPSIEALIEKTQSFIIQCDYPLAHKFAARVLQLDPTHREAQEMFGVILLELGEIDSAKQVGNITIAVPSLTENTDLPLARIWPFTTSFCASISRTTIRRRPKYRIKTLPGSH